MGAPRAGVPAEQVFEHYVYKYEKSCRHHSMFVYRHTKTSDLSEFGTGHLLYFYFVRYLTFLFLFITILQGVPLMVKFSTNGGFYIKGTLAKFTLGNYGPVYQEGLAFNQTADNGVHTVTVENVTAHAFRGPFATLSPLPTKHRPGVSKPQELTSLATLDAIILFLSCIAILCTSVLQRRVAKRAARDTITIADYSVAVAGLPMNTAPDKVVRYFEEVAGPVAKVYLQQDCSHIITVGKRRHKAKAKLEAALNATLKAATQQGTVPFTALAGLEKQEAKVERLETRFQAELANPRRIVSAFVTFKEAETQLLCLRKFKQATFFKRVKEEAPPEFEPGAKIKLIVTPALEPQDIIVENLGLTDFQRAMRRNGAAAMTYAVILASFAIISVVLTLQFKSVAVDDKCLSCGISQSGRSSISLTAEQKNVFKQCHDTGIISATGAACTSTQKLCYSCFCAQALLLAPFAYSSYCTNTITRLARRQGLAAAAVVSTAIVNQFLVYFVAFASTLQGHQSRTKSDAIQAKQLFVAQFLNSAIVQVIAAAKLDTLTKHLKGTPLDGVALTGKHSDLSPYWYRDIGTMLTINLGIQMLILIAKLGLAVADKRFRAARAAKCTTQTQLNEALAAPDFVLSERYGELLNILFVAFMFAGTIPFMSVLTFVGLFALYNAELFGLLKVFRSPHQQGAALADMALGLLPYAVILHMAWSLWGFSYTYVFTPSAGVAALVEQVLQIVSKFVLSATSATRFSARVSQANATPFLVCLVLLVIVFLLKAHHNRLGLAYCLRPILRRAGLSQPDGEEEQTSKVSFLVAVRSNLLLGPTSYSLGDNPHYADAFSTRHWNAAARQQERRERRGGADGAQWAEEEEDEGTGLAPEDEAAVAAQWEAGEFADGALEDGQSVSDGAARERAAGDRELDE